MKKFLFSLSILSLVVGCTKDNGGNENQPAENQLVIPKKIVANYKAEEYKNGAMVEVDARDETTIEVVDNKIVKNGNIDYQNNEKISESEVAYTYAGNLITKEVETFKSFSGGNATPTVSTTEYTYSAGKLTKKTEKSGSNDNAVVTNYEYQGDKLVKTLMVREDGYYTVSRTITFNYLSETQIKVVRTSVSSGFGQVRTSTRETEYTLDAQKRVIKVVEKNGEESTTTEYTYDDKNNLDAIDAFKAKTPESFLSPGLAKNNVVREKEIRKGSFFNSERTKTYTYTYNDKGYPTRLEEKTEREGEPARTRVTDYTY